MREVHPRGVLDSEGHQGFDPTRALMVDAGGPDLVDPLCAVVSMLL